MSAGVTSVSGMQKEVIDAGQAVLYGAQHVNGGEHVANNNWGRGDIGSGGANRPIMLETRLVRAILQTTKGLAIVHEAAQRALQGKIGWRKKIRQGKGGGKRKKAGSNDSTVSGGMEMFSPRVEVMLRNLLFESAAYYFDRRFEATRAVPDMEAIREQGWDVGNTVDIYREEDTGRYVLAGVEDMYDVGPDGSRTLAPRSADDPRNNVPMKIVIPAPETGHYYAVIERMSTETDVIWRYKPGFGSGATSSGAGHVGMAVDAKEEMKASVAPQRRSSPGVHVFIWPGGRPLPGLPQPLQSVVAPLVPSYQRLEQAWAYWQSASRFRASLLLVHGTGHQPQQRMSDREGDALSGTDIFTLCVKAGRAGTSMQHMQDMLSLEEAMQMQKVIHRNMVALGGQVRSNNVRIGFAGQVEEAPGALAESINSYMLPPGQATQSWPQPAAPAELMQMKEELGLDVDVAFGRAGGQRQRQNKMGGGNSDGGLGAARAASINVDGLALVLRTAFKQLFEKLAKWYGHILFDEHNKKVTKKVHKTIGRVQNYRDYLTYAKLTGALSEEPAIRQMMLDEETRRTDARFIELEQRAMAIQEEARRKFGITLTAGNIMEVIREAEEQAVQEMGRSVDVDADEIELVFERDVVPDIDVLAGLQATGAVRTDSITRMILRDIGVPEEEIEAMIITDEQKVQSELDMEEKKAKIAADNRPPPASASGGGGGAKKPKSSSSSSKK